MAAGLQLKNQLTSKDATVRLQYQQRWMTLDDKIKSHVKTMVRNLVELNVFRFTKSYSWVHTRAEVELN